jgi:hypothetical protein
MAFHEIFLNKEAGTEHFAKPGGRTGMLGLCEITKKL